jgi:hypothetical protein
MRILENTKEGWLHGITKKTYAGITIQTKSGNRIEISELPDGSIIIVKKNFAVRGEDTVIYKEFL